MYFSKVLEEVHQCALALARIWAQCRNCGRLLVILSLELVQLRDRGERVDLAERVLEEIDAFLGSFATCEVDVSNRNSLCDPKTG